MKRVAISQSNYIPWRGYFDLIAAVDEFVLYDDAQFTKNDWRNRNKIRTARGTEWISIPVGQDIHRRIRDVKLPSGDWRGRHWRMLETHYGAAPFFAEVSAMLAPFYRDHTHDMLCSFNRALVEALANHIGITTRLRWSWDYTLDVPSSSTDPRTEKLVRICQQAGAKEYLSAPAARGYLDEALFARAGIRVVWFDYDGYPDYPQLWKPFEPFVSIVDLLFNCGRDAASYMKNVRT